LPLQALGAAVASSFRVRRRQTRGFPPTKTAAHRAYIAVAHLLQAFRDERGTATTATITDDPLIEVRHLLFDLDFDLAPLEMLRAAGVAGVPILLRTHIDQRRRAAADLVHGIVRRNLLDVLLRFRNQRLKTVRVFHPQPSRVA
jgi:hypothetical protein